MCHLYYELIYFLSSAFIDHIYGEVSFFYKFLYCMISFCVVPFRPGPSCSIYLFICLSLSIYIYIYIHICYMYRYTFSLSLYISLSLYLSISLYIYIYICVYTCWREDQSLRRKSRVPVLMPPGSWSGRDLLICVSVRTILHV